MATVAKRSSPDDLRRAQIEKLEIAKEREKLRLDAERGNLVPAAQVAAAVGTCAVGLLAELEVLRGDCDEVHRAGRDGGLVGTRRAMKASIMRCRRRMATRLGALSGEFSPGSGETGSDE